MAGFLTRLLEPRAATDGPRSPVDDFWYQPLGWGTSTAAGVRMSPESALGISTVYACVRILAQTLAMLPLIVYRRLEPDGKERAPKHPAYRLLHTRPNPRQSSFQFREMLMGHALLRGKGYAQVVPGANGFADQLVPLHPDRMVKVGVAPDGTLHYTYRRADGNEVIFLQDEIFHLSTLSDDSINGMSLVTLARDSFGLAAATEQFGARWFSQGARPGGVLKHPGRLSKEAHANLRESWTENYGGLQGSHKPAILEEGLEWQALGMSNEDSQFLQTRSFQVEEIASWFGVPLALLQHTEKSTSWGSGIEHLTLGFVQFTLMPWLVRWEQEINEDLILDAENYFAEFLVEGLLRGDAASRVSFYRGMTEIGAMSPNEARVKENMNRYPDPDLDRPRRGGNLGGSAGNGPQPGQDTRDKALAHALAADAAARVVRREVAAVRKAAQRFAADDAAWRSWAAVFYEDLRAEIARDCHLPPESVLIYCIQNRDELLRAGAAVLDVWETDKPARLAALMLGGKDG